MFVILHPGSFSPISLTCDCFLNIKECMKRKFLSCLICVVIIAGCAGFEKQSRPGAPKIQSDISSGYLQPEAYPNSLAILPPPPADGSAALALDEEVSRESLAMQGSPRWDLAAQDAELIFPKAADAFSCALNAPITEKDTPHLVILMKRTIIDAGFSTYAAKSYYQRKRPFIVNKQPTCTPEEEKFLMKNGSYPSGHSAIGWAWALILCEIAPERADAIFKRGRAFGESRLVCNVHWHSDVVEGRLIGAAVVARLHAEPAFRADLEAAKAELRAVRTKRLKPKSDCKAESGETLKSR